MKTTLFLQFFCLFLGLVQSDDHGRPPHAQNKDCPASDDCIANGGYCIKNTRKGDCPGLLFPKECKSNQCSCCIEAVLLDDECQEAEDTCPTNSVCKDKDAGYDCLCNKGFGQCGDINECDSNPCGPNALCQNTFGSYVCNCNTGYEKVSGVCTDINECTPSNPCGAGGVCSNVPGNYTCNCNPGYTANNGTCVDIDECKAGTAQCSLNNVCANTIGSYSCPCIQGYTRVAATGPCNDIDECLNPAACQANSVCNNVAGGYQCNCSQGYAIVSGACVDVDECVTLNPCPANSYCVNTNGSYNCVCNSGFNKVGAACVDINECQSAPCADNQRCNNYPGGYNCTCYACANQCNHGVYDYFAKACYLLIKGSMTSQQAFDHCASEYHSLAPIRNEGDFWIFAGYTMENISGKAWVLRPPYYVGNLLGQCFVVDTTNPSSIAGYDVSCNATMEYSICTDLPNY